MRVSELLATTNTNVNVYKGNEKESFLYWSSHPAIPSPMRESDVADLEIKKVNLEFMKVNGESESFLRVIANEPTKKVKVFIEEHLCKEIVIEVPEYVPDEMDYAEQMAKQMYENEEIVLTADDYNGTRLMMVQDEDGHETGWFDF